MRAERDGEKNRKRGKGERGREKERDTCTLSKLREGGEMFTPLVPQRVCFVLASSAGS